MVINIFGREIVLEIKEKRKQGGDNGKKRKKFPSAVLPLK